MHHRREAPYLTCRYRFAGLRIALAFALAALFAGTAAARDATSASLLERPYVQVQGEGSVAARPDMARVDVGVVSEAESASAALSTNTEAMQILLRLLREQGIAEADLQTRGVEVNPVYDHGYSRERKDPRPVGYRVANRLEVRLRELDRLGPLLDAVVRHGANQVGGIVFGVQEPAPLLDRARREAVADAQRQARLYAEAAGVRLGPLLILEEQGGGPQPLQAMSVQRMEAVPVAPGELTLRVHVTARYGILN